MDNEYRAAWEELLRQRDFFYLYMLALALIAFVVYRSMSHVWKKLARLGLLLIVCGGVIWGLSHVIPWP
jgi:hypothetical protein